MNNEPGILAGELWPARAELWLMLAAELCGAVANAYTGIHTPTHALGMLATRLRLGNSGDLWPMYVELWLMLAKELRPILASEL